MNELIEQQQVFLKSQSLITYARLEFKDSLLDFHLVNGEWELEPIEKELDLQRTCTSCNCVLFPDEREYCDNCLDDNTSDNDVEQAVMSEFEVFDWERSNEEPPYIETVEHPHSVKPPKHR